MSPRRVLSQISVIILLLTLTNTCIWPLFGHSNCATIDGSDTLGVGWLGVCGCKVCNSGFYKNGVYSCLTCSSKYPNCQTCTTTVCSTCASGYSKNAAGNCLLCSTLCVGCITCNLISSPQTCNSCNPGLFVNSTFLCEACTNYLQNCTTCENSTTCTQCAQNFLLNSTNKCEPCRKYITNCSLCSVSTACTTCDASHTLLSSATLCAICQNLMPYCHVCNTPSTCQACNQTTLGINFTSIPHTCVSCSLNVSYCQECTLYSYCTRCVNNSFTVLPTSSQIRTCVTCDYFMAGCTTCSNSTYCQSCIDNNLYLYNSAGHSCQYCDYFLPFCATCLPSLVCLGCSITTYAISAGGTCESCQTFMEYCDICSSRWNCTHCLGGRLVADQTGCSRIIGCVSVYPLDSISNNCAACNTLEFHLAPQYGRCVCLEGWIVGSHCTTVIGCTAVRRVSNRSQCISCNAAQHFILRNITCICANHYAFTGLECIQICGDGFVIDAECDDGNFINGDGCSDSCLVQYSYQCGNDNSRYPSSKCQFKARIELSLVSIQKLAAPAYTGKITYDISPFSDMILKSNILGYVALNADGCAIKTAQVIGEQLFITFQYSKTIDNQIAQLVMNFDSQYVISPVAKLNFRMVQSQGVPLTYDKQFQFQASSQLIITALSILSLCVFAIGSLSFKMVGVQTLYTLQISWFLLNTSKYYKTFFTNLRTLNYSYGQISLTNEGEKVNNRFGNLGFTSSLNDSYLFYAILNGLIISTYIVALIYKYIVSQRIQSIEERIMSKVKTRNKYLAINSLKMQKIHTFLRVFYNWILFPILVGFFLHFIHTLYANQYKSSSGNTPLYYTLNILLAFIATSLIFHSQIFGLKGVQQNTILKDSAKRSYVSYFLVHNFLVFVLISMRMIKKNQIFCYIAIGLIIIYLIYLIAKRPYQRKIDNFSIILNQFAILFTFAWALTKGTSIDTFLISTLFVYGFISIFYSVNALALIRSALILKETYWNSTPVEKDKNQLKKIQKTNEIIEMVEIQKKGKFEIEEAMIMAKPSFNQLSLQSPFLNDNKLPFNKSMSGKNNILSARNYIRDRL